MNVFKLEFRNGRKSILIWTLIMAVVVAVFMCVFPSMSGEGMSQLMDGALSAMPQEMLEAFNLADIPDFSQIDQYFAYVFQYVLLASAILAAVMGATSLVREESEGTIEFLYAQPVTRTAIVTQKMFCNVLLFLLYAVVVALASVGSIYLFLPEGVDFMEMLPRVGVVFAGLLLTCFTFMAFGFFASSLLRSHRTATPLALAAVFLTYFAGIASKLVERLSWLWYCSPVHYSTPATLIADGAIDIRAGIIAGCAIFLFVSLSYIWYLNKDFKV
ncbi:ABC transporter permease [Zongyangia hominis]|uniref:ABC transporter permease n=1 Tax=Zongyangia hominis TaxID=2763677 RepID=A0A926I664_9FIRM|nr:ABC transporter permease [Zongyangia hominis]MBC8569699.1 ABC transporter permease [Zongyangia hominis]